jgi:hypothetical protein
MGHSQKSLLNVTPSDSHKTNERPHFAHNNSSDKVGFNRQDSINKQAIIDRIEEIRRNAQTPKFEEPNLSKILTKKSEVLSSHK